MAIRSTDSLLWSCAPLEWNSSSSSSSSKHHGSNESTDGSCSTRKPVDRHTCHGYSL